MSTSSPVIISRTTTRRLASRTFAFDTFTVDMEECHGEAHNLCLEAVSSDFQLLHLHKLVSDTIFFVTDVINRVLMPNLSFHRSHEESWSSLRVSVQKIWTQYIRAYEWLPQVSSTCKCTSGVDRLVDVGVQETPRERCNIPDTSGCGSS